MRNLKFQTEPVARSVELASARIEIKIIRLSFYLFMIKRKVLMELLLVGIVL